MAREYPTGRQSRRQSRQRVHQDTYEDVFGDEHDEDGGTTFRDEDTGYDDEAMEESYAPARPQRPAKAEPAVISTNSVINITCALAASTGVIGLFLYFADKRSIAVRRTAVQSACLFVVNCFVTAILWALAFIISSASLWGNAFWILWMVYFIIAGAFRWQLALHAYQGRAYILPLVGEFSRRFE